MTRDQAAAAEGISRTEFILRCCQERARDVLLDRTLFPLTPEQTTALLTDLEDPGSASGDQASIERLLAMPQPCLAAQHARSPPRCGAGPSGA
jgi:uncharacterized protein (DUF1778 family)